MKTLKDALELSAGLSLTKEMKDLALSVESPELVPLEEFEPEQGTCDLAKNYKAGSLAIQVLYFGPVPRLIDVKQL